MEIKPADKEIIDHKDLRYKRKVSNKGIKEMNKQAYEHTVGLVLSKTAAPNLKPLQPAFNKVVKWVGGQLGKARKYVGRQINNFKTGLNYDNVVSDLATQQGNAQGVLDRAIMTPISSTSKQTLPSRLQGTAEVWNKAGRPELAQMAQSAHNTISEAATPGLKHTYSKSLITPDAAKVFRNTEYRVRRLPQGTKPTIEDENILKLRDYMRVLNDNYQQMGAITGSRKAVDAAYNGANGFWRNLGKVMSGLK